MITYPNLIFYACISKGTTILAEFNSKGADLGALAVKCLEKTPPLHSVLSHTFQKKTYTFLIDEPFVYFAIFDHKLENSEGLFFLKSVKDAFNEIVDTKLDNLNSHCFQGEFSPVFHQLLASPADMEVPISPRVVLKHGQSASLDSPRGKKIGSMPLLGDAHKSLMKKKKKRLFGETKGKGNDVLTEKKVDVSGDSLGLSREFSVTMQKTGLYATDVGHQKAKRVWKKQVWVVLLLDLIVCSVLFAIWLCICRGFKCIDG